jgi:hypothetical protein
MAFLHMPGVRTLTDNVPLFSTLQAVPNWGFVRQPAWRRAYAALEYYSAF